MYITDVWLCTLQGVYLNKGMNHYGYNNFFVPSASAACVPAHRGAFRCDVA